MMELEVFIFTLEDMLSSQMYFLVVRSCIVKILTEEEDAFYLFISSFLESLSNFIALSFVSKLETWPAGSVPVHHKSTLCCWRQSLADVCGEKKTQLYWL